MIYFCCDERRRSLVRAHPALYGIDHLEVVDTELKDTSRADERQRHLRVFLVHKPGAPGADAVAARQQFRARLASLTPERVRITGGDAVRGIAVKSVALHSASDDRVEPGELKDLEPGDHLKIIVTPRGDYSTYTLSLIGADASHALEGLDPRLASVDFSFKVECESQFDCRPACACPPAITSAPDLDYLAKDYASFRQLMLDRLALLVPDWRERNPADLGITLVELLAYVGDYLSYRQDAVSTEAYLGTARRRVSVRRHAALVDYAMHEGCNARTWVQVRVRETGGPGIRPEWRKAGLDLFRDPNEWAARLDGR